MSIVESRQEIDDAHSEADVETELALATILDASGRNSVFSPDCHMSCPFRGSASHATMSLCKLQSKRLD